MRVLLISYVFCLSLCSGLMISVPSGAYEGVDRSYSSYASGNESDAFSFNGRIMFYNWGDRSVVPHIEEVHYRFPTLYDSLRSQGQKEITKFGADCDFMGNVSLGYLSDAGTLYGLRFQLMIPEIANSIDEGKALVNNGNSAFVVTPFGKFSVGYQEGVESAFAEIGNKYGEVFDDFVGGRDPTLMKYKLPLLKGDFFKNGEGQWLLHNSVILYPGLYSENVSRTNNHLNYYGSGRYSKYFVNSLPFRVSYQSPKLYGMRFGLSYSPWGYREGLFEGVLGVNSSAVKFSPFDSSQKDVGLEGGQHTMDLYQEFSSLFSSSLALAAFSKSMFSTEPSKIVGSRFVYAPSYKGIVSAAWSLIKEFKMGDGRPSLKTQLLLTGEYASAGSRFELATGVNAPRGWFRDLAAVGVTLSAEGGGLTLMGSYGYLGKSGYYEGPIEGTVLSYEKYDALSVLKPSYYFVLGGKYSMGPVHIEMSHFSSVKGGYLSLGRVSDQGVRVGYELYRDASTKCVLFAQLQRISARYSFAQGFVVGQGERRGAVVSSMKYSFDVLAAGVKVVF